MNIFNKIGRLSWPLMFVAVVLLSQVCGADEYGRRDDDEPCPTKFCPPPPPPPQPSNSQQWFDMIFGG